MLLTLHNLPPDMRYSDIKSLLRDKCGLTEVILDNLLPTGNSKKVTIGVSEEADAAIIVRKINGLHIKGQQLYVEDIRKKRKANEQPFRTSDSYYSADTIKELVPEPAAVQPYVDPQTAYQMNYTMMAGMYGGYIPPVQDPNYGYAAQAMPVMPVVPALHPTGMPVTNQTNDWQTSQSQLDLWQNTQGRAEPRQALNDREDPWKNPLTRESFRHDRDTRDDPREKSQGFRQRGKGQDDSRQNQPARESFRPKPAPREDSWNNTNTRKSSRQHNHNLGHVASENTMSIQERASRWAAERTALMETPAVEEARPYFEHGRPEMSRRPEVPRRDERRRSPSDRRWGSNDGAGYGHDRNEYNDDQQQRSPHGSGRYEPEPRIVHNTVNSVNVTTVMDRGYTETRRTERYIVAEPVRYGPRSPDRDDSRPRPSRRDFEEPPRPFRGEKRARYDEPYQAPVEDRQTRYEEPAFPAPIENVSHWDEPRHSTERQGRRFKEGPSFDTPRPEIADMRPPEMTQAAKMMNREETHRQQTTSKIAKIMSERSPNMFSLLFMKILKQTIRIRLDRILRDECGNDVTDMLRRYTDKFPRAADLHTIRAVSKRVDLVLAEREMQTLQSNNGVSADVVPQATPATVQAPRKLPAATLVEVPEGELPRYPNKDKGLVYQQKQMQKLESQHDDLYPLPPKTKAALDKELEAIANAIKEECADPIEGDKITCERIKTETVDDMKKRNYRESSDSPLTSDTSTETVFIGLASPDSSPVDNFTGTNTNCDTFEEIDNVNSQTEIKYEVREVKCDTIGNEDNVERQTEIKHEVKETFEAKCEIFEGEDNFNSQTEINNEVIEACKANCDNFEEIGNSGSQPEITHEVKEEEPYEDSILVVNEDQEDIYNDKIFNINAEEEEAFIDKILGAKNIKKHDINTENEVEDEIILPKRRKKCQREDIIVNMIRNEHGDDIDTAKKEVNQISFNASGDSDVELQEKFYDSITNIGHNKTEIALQLDKALPDNIAEADIRILLGCGKRQIVLNSKLTDNNTGWAAIHHNASENNTSQNIYDNVNTEMLETMYKPVNSESELVDDVIDSAIKIVTSCKRKRELGSKLSDNETKLVEPNANNSSEDKTLCGVYNCKKIENKSANRDIYLDQNLDEDGIRYSRRKRRRRSRKKLRYESTQWAQSNNNTNEDNTSHIYDNVNTEMLEIMYKPFNSENELDEDVIDSDIKISTSCKRKRELGSKRLDNATKLVEFNANNTNEEVACGIYNLKKDENKSANMEIYIHENIDEDEIRSSRRKCRRRSRKDLRYDTTQWAQSNNDTNEDNSLQDYPEKHKTEIFETTNEPAHLEKEFDEDIADCDIKSPSNRCKQRRKINSSLADDQTKWVVSNSNKENTVRNIHNNGRTQEPELTNKSKEILVRSCQESDVSSLLARLRNEEKEIPKVNTTNIKINWQYREKDIDDLLAKIRKQEES